MGYECQTFPHAEDWPWVTFDADPEDREEFLRMETEWETQGIQRGVERVRKDYDDANAKAHEKGTGGLAETDVGQIVLKEVVRPMVDAIREYQAEALTSLATKRGTKSRWWIPILSLEPEKWAVITVRSVLTGMTAELKDSRPATPLALAIGKYGKLQREFDLWKKREAQKRKDANSQGEDYRDLYKLMVKSVKKVDARTAKKWMKLSEDADRLEWSKDDMVALGILLLNIMVERGGGWFEMVLVGRGVNRHHVTERQIKLTDAAKSFIHKKQSVTELQRPWLVPMKCPPKPWVWVDGKAKAEGTEEAQPDGDGADAKPVASEGQA